MEAVDTQPFLSTCYRHPDRETRLSCTRCDRPVCVDCVSAAAVGQRCPECAAEETRVISTRDLGRAERGSPVTTTLLAVTVGIFVAGMLVPEWYEAMFVFGAQIHELVEAGQWYRLITAAFLHDRGLAHIGFNMYALYVLGPSLEQRVGSAPFAALYGGAALAGGAVFHVLTPGGVAIGASGAIFGLFGAWLVASFRTRRSVAGAAGFRQMLMLLAINMALPLIIPRIAWQAHVGGLVAGVLVAATWMIVRGRTAQASLARAGAGVAIAALSIATVMAT